MKTFVLYAQGSEPGLIYGPFEAQDPEKAAKKMNASLCEDLGNNKWRLSHGDGVTAQSWVLCQLTAKTTDDLSRLIRRDS